MRSRDGLAITYDSGDYPACQADLLAAVGYDGFPAEQAAAHPLPNAHSIWELVLHITAWENAARKALEGEPLHVSEGDNFPAISDTSEAAWHDALTTLEASHYMLRAALDHLTDDALDNVVPGRRYSIYVLLHGIVQHDLYHAGQIVMLKKALAA